MKDFKVVYTLNPVPLQSLIKLWERHSGSSLAHHWMVLFYSELTGSFYLNPCELIFYWSSIVIDTNRGFSHTRWKLTKSTHFMRSPWVQFWNLTGNLFVGWSLYGNSLYGNDCAEKALYCCWKPGRYSELLGTCSPSQISLRHRAEHSLKFYFKKPLITCFVDVCVNRKEKLKTEQINTSRKSIIEQYSGCHQLHHLEYGDY